MPLTGVEVDGFDVLVAIALEMLLLIGVLAAMLTGCSESVEISHRACSRYPFGHPTWGIAGLALTDLMKTFPAVCLGAFIDPEWA
jgi:hypothetical protein